MAEQRYTVTQILTYLAEGPERLMALTDGVDPALLRTAPTPDEWPATDILAHLRSCGDMWGGFIRRMLTEDKPTIRAVNPRRWIKQTNYRELEFHPSLAAFVAQRAELLATLRSLPPEGWLRTATMIGGGKPRVRDVHHYGDGLARHERPHIRQIAAVIKMLRGEDL